MGYSVFEMLCKSKGVKPSDVSRATGISTATLSSWKSGRYSPKIGKLQKIADYFGVTVEYLITGDDPGEYYTNPATAKIAQEIFENYELHALFDAARDSAPEDLKAVHDMLVLLKRKEKRD